MAQRKRTEAQKQAEIKLRQKTEVIKLNFRIDRPEELALYQWLLKQCNGDRRKIASEVKKLINKNVGINQ